MDHLAKLVALALLAAAPVSHAASSVNLPFQNFMRNVTGVGSATVSFSGSGTPILAAPPTSLGGTSGWSTASNFASRATSAGGAEIATSGLIGVGKYNVPVTLTGSATKSALAAGMKTTFMAVGRVSGPLGMAFTALELIDYMAANGVRENPSKSDPTKPFLVKKEVPGTVYSISGVDWFPSKSETCSASAASKSYPAGPGYLAVSFTVVSVLPLCVLNRTEGPYPPTQGQWGYQEKFGMTLEEFPASLSDIEPYLTRPATVPLPDFIDATEKIRTAHPNAGIDPFKVDLQWEKASGPATLPAPAPTTTTTTKVNPDGSTTTTTTTTTKTPTATYTGNKIDVSEKEKTTTEEKTCTDTVNCTAPTKPKPDEETDKPAPEETDLCKLHPDILACVKVAKPGELEPTPVPNDVKNLQITPDQGWGPSAGTCPAPKTAQVMGVALEMPFTMLCDFASAIKPLFIAFAWLSAALTFFGFGRKD